MKGLWRRMGIESGEEAVCAWSAIALFLVGWASVSITNASETLFLKRVGVELLPFVFLANSALLVMTTSAMGRIAARGDHARRLTNTLLVLSSGILLLWLLVAADVRYALFLLAIASKQVESIGLLAFWITLGGLLHSRQAKRLYAPLMAGGTLGSIAGSFASGLVGRVWGIASVLAVAAAALLLAGALTIPLRRFLPPWLGHAPAPPSRGAERARKSLPLRALWREGRLFRYVAASSVLSGFLGPLLYFQFSYVADRATQGSLGEQHLLDLYAQLRGWINIGVFALQVWGTSGLFRRFGLPLAASLSPLIYLVGFAGLTLRMSLPTGVSAMAGAQLQDHAVYDPAQRILLTLFRERIRPAVTAVVDGPLKRGGAAVGSLVILGALALGSPVWVGVTGLPFAIVWLGIALALWRIYPSLLLEAAAHASGPDAGDAGSLGRLMSSNTARGLERSLIDPDLERCRAACRLLGEAPRDCAAAVLARAARRASDANRLLVVRTLEGVLARDDGVAPPTAKEVVTELEALVAAPLGLPELERAILVRAYGTYATSGRPGGGRSRRCQDLLRQLCADPAEAVRLAAAAALRRAQASPAPGAQVARDHGLDPNLDRSRDPSRSDTLADTLSNALGSTLDRTLSAALRAANPAVRHVARAELRAILLQANATNGADAGNSADAASRADAANRAEGADGASPGADARWTSGLALLTDLLPERGDRAAAIGILADVARRHGARVAPASAAVLACREDPDPAVRTQVIRFVGALGRDEHAPWLIERLTARNRAEAATAADALRTRGGAVLNLLLDALHCGARSTQNAILEILRELPAAPDRLRGLVDCEIDRMRRAAMLAYVLRARQVSELVLMRLEERIQESADTALRLLAALLHDGRVVKLCRLLGRRLDAREHAVIVEALEATLPPEPRGRLVPLLEGRDPAARALEAAKALGTALPAFDAALDEALSGSDRLTQAFLWATLDAETLARRGGASNAPVADATGSPLAPSAEMRKDGERGFRCLPGDSGVVGGGPAAETAETAGTAETAMRNSVEIVLQLRSLDIFQELTTRQLTDLAAVVREEAYQPGTVIVRAGAFDDCMYFIVDGTVRIVGGDRTLAELGPREFFGEMAMFDGETRSATAVAASQARLLRLERQDLFAVMEERPGIAIAICRMLTRRVRQLNERLEAAQRKR